MYMREQIKELLEKLKLSRNTFWVCGFCGYNNVNKPKINCTACKEDYRNEFEKPIRGN